MPVRHYIDRSHRLVITVYRGEVSRDEVVTTLKELKNDSEFQPEFSQIADLSQVSKLNLGFQDMLYIRLHDPFSTEARRAVYAPGELALFGVSRMYELVLDSQHFGVFKTLVEAFSWLGLEITAQQTIIHTCAKRDR